MYEVSLPPTYLNNLERNSRFESIWSAFNPLLLDVHKKVNN